MPSTYGLPFPVVETSLCKMCEYNRTKYITVKLKKILLTKAELSNDKIA
jgi:hypothetical protein